MNKLLHPLLMVVFFGGGSTILAQPGMAQGAAGMSAHVELTVMGVEQATPVNMSVVVAWNEVALAAIRNGPPYPTVIARSLYITHAAMYDAWAMYDTTATPVQMDASLRRPIAEHTLENQRAAVSYAAYQALTALFPDYAGNTGAFVRLLQQQGYAPLPPGGGTPTTPGSLGKVAADTLLASRRNDGSNMDRDYEQSTSGMYLTLYEPRNAADPASPYAPGGDQFNVNAWQPLRIPTGMMQQDGNAITVSDKPESYVDQTFLTPHWGAVRPFALAHGDQFRPPAPPQHGSDAPYTDGLGITSTNDAAFWSQMNEVITISADLTDEHKVIAEYWADGPRSETPPGHWNALAHGISLRDGHTLEQDVKLYFALNGALFDASIAAWDAKRVYDYIRPVSAIRHLYYDQPITAWAGPNKGTATINGQDWQPYQATTFVTPAFAEYVSGHSTFSMAAAEVLTRFTGSDAFYDGQTVVNKDYNRDGVPDMLGQYIAPANSNRFEVGPAAPVVLAWPTFFDAAVQAGYSRLYGGIHFQDGDLNGRTLGQQVGETAYAMAEMYWTGGR